MTYACTCVPEQLWLRNTHQQYLYPVSIRLATCEIFGIMIQLVTVSKSGWVWEWSRLNEIAVICIGNIYISSHSWTHSRHLAAMNQHDPVCTLCTEGHGTKMGEAQNNAKIDAIWNTVHMLILSICYQFDRKITPFSQVWRHTQVAGYSLGSWQAINKQNHLSKYAPFNVWIFIPSAAQSVSQLTENKLFFKTLQPLKLWSKPVGNPLTNLLYQIKYSLTL